MVNVDDLEWTVAVTRYGEAQLIIERFVRVSGPRAFALKGLFKLRTAVDLCSESSVARGLDALAFAFHYVLPVDREFALLFERLVALLNELVHQIACGFRQSGFVIAPGAR